MTPDDRPDDRPPAIRIADDVNELLRASTTHETHDTFVAATVRVPVPRPELWAQHDVDASTDIELIARTPIERITTWEKRRIVHSVKHASLLEQLEAAITSSPLTSDDPFSSTPQSKPAARLDAIAVLHRIDRESTRWAQVLRSRTRVPMADRLRGIVGAAASADPALVAGDDVVKGGLAGAVHGWLIAAKVATGWERPTWAPNVPCPNIECEQRGTIRIRLEQGIGLCTACGTYWDRANIARLGDYVRWAAEHLAGARHWLYDGDGYPIECTECLATREQMAERQGQRIKAAKSPSTTTDQIGA